MFHDSSHRPDPESAHARTRRPASTAPETVPAVRAAVAVVLRPSAFGGVWALISHRLPDAHLPDLWEFPGGKIHPGESGAECVRREVREETGLLVEVLGPLLDREYHYPDRKVQLEFYVCAFRGGLPQALESQAVRWARLSNLDCYPFPDANEPIVEALRRGGWLAESV
jgi:8-oxo-dGTP diphosphatase